MDRYDFTIVQPQPRQIGIIVIGAPRQLPEREHLARFDDQLRMRRETTFRLWALLY